MNEVRKVIIIGGGPAGYTAALYAARADLEPLVIEGFTFGGQLMITSDVENYPGFSDGILGPELMVQFREQAERFGAEYLTDDVTRVDFSERPFRVSVGDDEYLAETVIIATGATARQLGLPPSKPPGQGVTYCAVCDAAFYREKEVVVAGGGDSAMEEAIFLAKFVDKVTIVHRRDEFRASNIMLDRARANEKIEWLTNSVIEEVIGEQKMTGVRIRNTQTGRDVRASGGRPLRRDRSRPEHEALRRLDRPRRGRLPRHEAAARPRRTSRASSPSATSRTTSTARRSRPPAPARWARSTPSASSPRAKAI